MTVTTESSERPERRPKSTFLQEYPQRSGRVFGVILAALIASALFTLWLVQSDAAHVFSTNNPAVDIKGLLEKVWPGNLSSLSFGP